MLLRGVFLGLRVLAHFDTKLYMKTRYNFDKKL